MAFEDDDDIWFPAKNYGWGWGLPITWQGWLVVAVYLLLLIGGTIGHYQAMLPIPYSVFLVAITLGLVGVCWLKGETPSWRWGGE